MEIKTQYDAGAGAFTNGTNNDNSVFHHAGGSTNGVSDNSVFHHADGSTNGGKSNNGANGASGGGGGGSGGGGPANGGDVVSEGDGGSGVGQGLTKSKSRGRVHLVPPASTAPTHQPQGDRGLYEQGHGSAFGKPPPRHSPAHKGYDRNNAREEAFAWMRGVMHDAEWALPPVARPLDYVPVGVRPMFQDLFTEMLHWLDRYPDDTERWFMLVRAWPRLVCAPLRRGGGNASDQLMKRLAHSARGRE